MPVKASINLTGIIAPEGIDTEPFERVSLKTVKAQVAALPKGTKRVQLVMDSDGGVMQEGWAIYDYLLSTGLVFDTVGFRVVASMMTPLFLLGETRQLSKNCEFIIHMPSGSGWGGNQFEIDDYLQSLIREGKKLIDLYTSKTGKSESQIAGLLADGKDHLFTAQEAIAYGWATAIYTGVSTKAVTARTIQQYPAIARLCENPAGPDSPTKKPTTSIMGSLTETFNEFLAKAQKIITGGTTNLAVSTADGQSLVIETGDRVDYAVGDAVLVDGQPVADGDYILSDNATISVVAGLITVITPAATNEVGEEEEPTAQADADTVTISKAEHERLLALDAKVTDLASSVDTMKAKVTEYDTVTAQMKTQLSSMKSANPLTAKLPEVKSVGNAREMVEESDPVARKAARIAARTSK